MDIKTAAALHRLRLVSIPEAISFPILLVCSVLKRTTDFNGVPVMGWVHAILFLAYVVFLLDAWNRTKWPWKTAAVYFLLAIPPFGGLFAERKLKREAEAAVIASRARREGVVNA
ncbi:DUF3817 domain-containing protein [Streptomyces sp. NPDC050703]|uniref:DUF3817 domain-containing protein n=1 Tax=Streptomyces sp. NPDC050703 TaxID=3157218 RepID=UPI0034387740